MPTPKGVRARSKSPGRKTSRSRSRGRSKSPARSKSPGRPKSPARPKSPGRPRRTQEKTVATPEKPVQEEAKPAPAITPTTSSRRSARIENQIKDEPQKKEPKAESSRLAKVTKPNGKWNFHVGPIFMLLLVVLLPEMVCYINEVCSSNVADMRKFPVIPKKVSDYVNKEAVLMVLGFVLLQLVLAVIPVGKVVDGLPGKAGKKHKYRCNGLFALFITLHVFAGAVYLKAPLDLAIKNFRQLIVVSTILALKLSIFLYLHARKLSTTETASNTGNVVTDFFLGRELSPKIRSLELKFFFQVRVRYIGWAVLNGIFLYSDYTKGALNPVLAAVSAGQIFYALDALAFEETVLASHDMQTEGFGYLLAFTDLVYQPFFAILPVRYLYYHRQSYPHYCLGSLLVMAVIGYIISRGSKSQKSKFLQNPQSPELAHLDTIPTSSGRKLLASGWWGLCRQPNYLGDMLIDISWTLACGLGSLVPYVYLLCRLVRYVVRQRRYDAISRQKYGAAWDRYCERVKYRIVPYIY